ncbi:MAG: FKBP-type peptidyl-prolyl cis-trans isomerase [Dermatophilaceae bacterium]
MSPFRLPAVVAAVVAAGLLGACGGSTPDPAPSSRSATAGATAAAPLGSPDDQKVLDGITVTGGGGQAPPTITLASTPVSVGSTSRRVLQPGTGAASTKDAFVKTQLTLVLGKDGKVLNTTYGQGGAQTFLLSDTTTIKGLTAGLTDVQGGSRVLLVIPPADGFGAAGRADLGVSGTDNLVLVADVASVAIPLKAAEGTDIAPAPGLPTVTFDPTKGPTITVPSGASAPEGTVVQPLVKGSGPALAAGQLVRVHYTGALWKDGSVFDSSWTRGTPFDFTIGEGKVIKAWDTSLVGVTVGSRVVLVVPPKDGYGDAGSPPKIAGTDTLVFVIDILAAA